MMSMVLAAGGFVFNTKIGRYALGAAGVFALVSWFAVSNQHKGAVKERERVQQAGAKVERKATVARTAAERDARRVLERYRRD